MAKAKTPTKKKSPAKKPSTKATAAKSTAKSQATKPSTKGKAAKSAKPVVKVKASKSDAKTSLSDKLLKHKKPLLVLAAVLVLVSGSLLLSKLNSDEAEPAAATGDPVAAKAFSDEIIQHLRNGECQQIYDQTSEGFQSVITKETWLEQCGIASGVLTGTVTPVEHTDSNLDDDISEFVYKITATDDETYVITTELVYRDGQWQLQGINSQVDVEEGQSVEE